MPNWRCQTGDTNQLWSRIRTRAKELLDPGSVRWGLFPSFIYYAVVRAFMIILIILVLVVWLAATEQSGWTKPSWLTWVEYIFGGLLIPAAIVVGLVQLMVIVFIVLRLRAKSQEQQIDWCSWKQLVKTSKIILNLLLFEWTVVNLVILVATLTIINLPTGNLPYDTDVAFIITVGSAIFHYYLYIVYYTKRKPVEYWRKKDIVVIVSPFVLIVLALLIIVTILYFGVSAQDLAQLTLVEIQNRLTSWIIFLIILFLITFMVVPLSVYYAIVRPLQRRRFQRRAAAEPVVATKEPTLMEKAIRSKCEEKLTAIEEMRSLLLIGLGIDRISGLERAYCLSRLYLSCNQISSVDPLSHLPALETLNLEDNLISDYGGLLPLRRITSLRRLNIERNPLCSQRGFDLAKVSAMLPQLESISGISVSSAMRKQAEAIPESWLNSVVLAAEKKAALASVSKYPAFIHNYMVRRGLGYGEVMVGAPVRGGGISWTQHDCRSSVNFESSLHTLRDEAIVRSVWAEGDGGYAYGAGAAHHRTSRTRTRTRTSTAGSRGMFGFKGLNLGVAGLLWRGDGGRVSSNDAYKSGKGKGNGRGRMQSHGHLREEGDEILWEESESGSEGGEGGGEGRVASDTDSVDVTGRARDGVESDGDNDSEDGAAGVGSMV